MKGKPLNQRDRLAEPLSLPDNGVGKDLDTKDPEFLKKLGEEAGFKVEEG